MSGAPSPRSGSPLPIRSSSPANASTKKTTSFVPAWRRPILPQSDNNGGRRTSVQFVPQVKTDSATPQAVSRSSSAQPPPKRPPLAAAGTATGRRLSSPPPPAQFRSSVSFDTFNNKEASDFSLTLNRKHRDYEYTKRSRTFLCGTDTNDYSDTALEWLIEEIVDDGDEVVCLRVVEKDSKEALKWSGGLGEKGYRREAERFLDGIEKKNATEDRAISLILEFSIGKVQETIQQMIKIYEPAMLVVGTRGRDLTGYKGLLSSGSVSKYCLQYSPVPVIVVRPSAKREKKKAKRQRDPERTGYRDILDKSDEAPRGRGGHLLDPQNRMSIAGANLGALGDFGSAAKDSDHEARMVAEAIGWKGKTASPRSGTPLGSRREGSLSRQASVDNGTNNKPRRESSLSRTATNNSENDPTGALLKSPDLQNLESPPSSPSSDEDEVVTSPPVQEDLLRPEDEAARLAYERAMKVVEEEAEEAEARVQREQERSARSASRGPKGAGSRSASKRRGEDPESGSAVLGLLSQLERGVDKM